MNEAVYLHYLEKKKANQVLPILANVAANKTGISQAVGHAPALKSSLRAAGSAVCCVCVFVCVGSINVIDLLCCYPTPPSSLHPHPQLLLNRTTSAAAPNCAGSSGKSSDCGSARNTPSETTNCSAARRGMASPIISACASVLS